MNNTAIQLLEYDKIKEKIMEYAISEQAKERIGKLQPSIDPGVIQGWLDEAAETRVIVDRSSSIPLQSLTDMEKIMNKLGKDPILLPDELSCIGNLLEGGRRMKRFMAERQEIAPVVASYARSISDLSELADEIRRCIENGMVDDKASAELSKIRKKLTITDERIRSKLESILKSPAYQGILQDATVSIRSGTYVIPVKREYRRNMEGSVLDTSSSGSTVFIEPAAIKKLREELNLLRIEEEKEVYRILSCLTALAESYKKELSINIETMAHYDFLFAKAKYSRDIDGSAVRLNTRGLINIRGAKHPLIGRSAVPLDFIIGERYNSLIITGPNTGGKTVVLKTVGLLTMMVQTGIQVPVEPGSEFAVFHDILADIGDGQSIEQSLSTFSSHIQNIISILECAGRNTLVIMDELGAGTDPGEGMGLAVAVLEKIHEQGATLLATTHYSEIKDFAGNHPGFENGCMEFDIQTLKPLYRLKIGMSGESNAFLIALRLGMDKKLIERAHEITYKEQRSYPDFRNKTGDVTLPHREQSLPSLKIEPDKKRTEKQKPIPSFVVGDCVYISSLGRTGIICETENARGEVVVMVQKNRIKVNKKRLSLYIDGKELYPQNYDFDIVFETKENRKKRHELSRKHVEGLSIETPGES